MAKKLLILFLILALLAGGITVYLNNVFLPRQIKSLLVNGIQEATHKNVTLGRLRFSLFKGLVLEDLRIYDEKETLLRLKEASCIFLVFPIFQKKIIIPSVQLRSAELFLERRADNTFNIQGLLPGGAPGGKPKFEVLVSRVRIVNSRIVFRDDTLAPPFEKGIENLNMAVRLSLPASVKFDLEAEIPAKPLAKIKAAGEYLLSDGKFTAKIYLQDIPPQEFLPYYRGSGLQFTRGILDGSADIALDNSELSGKLSLRSKDISLIKDGISAEMNLEVGAEAKFGLKSKEMDYAGSLQLKSAQIKIEKFPDPLKNVNGKIDFFKNQVKWEKLKLEYQGVLYNTSGVVTDFNSPGVQLELASSDISLQSNFAFNNGIIKLSRLKGNYLNSQFTANGEIDVNNASGPEAELTAEIALDLKDTAVPLKRFKGQLEQIKPQGLIKAQARLSGNIADFKKLIIQANGSGEGVSLYGLHSQGLTFDYNQAEGVAKIPQMHITAYDGTLDINASCNLDSQNLPYLISAQAEGIKLESLKKDTQMKNQDISGSLAAQLKLNGFANDPGSLSGEGKISVTEAKLWQLNLFKGLGSLIFSKDFSSIVFSEASCDFSVQDQYISTDNLKMLSNISNLEGKARIGFDSSLDISLNVKVQDENAPLTGTFKDLTTALIGQSGRLGVIRITGTLKEPKYKFQAAVADIIKGLKDAIFGK
ncbi:MAG TPA: AsmA family protein [Candidatus Margulisiibacteriota bacterium]|nr:AsmA family protein [Candidatus Margulisiibacteriota bacterium]